LNSVGFLLDSNVVSELRKGDRCAPAVWRWRQRIAIEEIFLSVLVMGELRRGIENVRHKDAVSARALEKWLRELESVYRHRILPVTSEIADVWGRLSIRSPLPILDALMAATALHHQLTLVTRNIRDVKRSGADCLDPFVD
jgi:predicted nucleic acid-binding protein